MNREEFKSFLQNIDLNVHNFTNEAKENSYFEKFQLERMSLELLIMKSLKKPFILYLTGLNLLGLAMDDDTVDLHIVLGKNFYANSDISRDIGIIDFLGDVLDNSGEWSVYKRFKNEAIIECMCHLTDRKFRLCIGNGLGYEQYKILKHLFAIQPEAAQFFIFLKHWIKMKCFCSINSKTLLLLVVFYLQSRQIMPSLFEVFLNIPKITIDGNQILRIDELRNMHYYKLKRMVYYQDYILDFFDFYRYFDFMLDIISIYRGYKISCRNNSTYYNRTSALNVIFIDTKKKFL